MKRRQPAVAGGTVLPALPSVSTLLAKLVNLRAFCSETSYDDGSPRQPGYFTFRNRVTVYEVTVYDPDSGTRLVVRGPDWDKTFLSVEQLLGAADAPWEMDKYLSEQLAKRSRKKGA